VTTAAVSRAKLQSNRHHQQTDTRLSTGWMRFLLPNRQRQNTNGWLNENQKYSSLIKKACTCPRVNIGNFSRTPEQFWPKADGIVRRKRTQNCEFVISLGSLMIRVQFWSGSEYFKKIRFVFSSSSVKVGFGFFIDVIENINLNIYCDHD